MEKKKEKMTIGKNIFLTKTFKGLFFVFSGITQMIGNDFFNKISIFLFSCSLILIFTGMHSDTENMDEMAIQNYNQARAISCEIMTLFFLVVLLIIEFLSLINFDLVFGNKILTGILVIIIGIQDFISGFVFHKLEAK